MERKNRLGRWILLLTVASGTAAGEGGCLSAEWQRSASAAELRERAATCESKEGTTLLYNRAYHLDLLGRYRSVIRLQPGSGQEDFKHYHAYRMFIGLTEAFAAYRGDRDEPPAALLNLVYDRATEIAELRLRGYDLQADRLERETWSLDK
jgi:hypothetical protein